MAGAVERVGHRADQQARGVARQLRVRVERDDVLHLAENARVPDDAGELAVGPAAEQRVQIAQLPALALVPHPDALLGVPAPRAVEEEERAWRVLPVQIGDQALGEKHEGLVLREGFVGGIGQVRQQSERDVFVPIAEKPDFQRFDQTLDVLGARDQGRNDDEGPGGGRDAARQVHLRQGLGPREPGYEDVHERDRHLTRAEQEEDAEQPDEPVRRAFRPDLECQRCRGQHREGGDAPEIEQQRVAEACAPRGFPKADAHVRGPFHLRETLPDKVEADVRCPRIGARGRGGVTGQSDGQVGDFAFGVRAPPGRHLHDVAVVVPRGEVHQRVHASRVLPEGPVDDASRLHEIAPVGGSEEPQAADAVADRNLVGRLLLVLRLHQLLDRERVLRQPLFDPGQRQGERGALPLQATRKLRDERADHRGARPRHVRDHENEALRVLLGDRHHLIGPVVRPVPVHAVGAHPRRHTAEVLQQGEPQHDRDGPQLADAERGHRLVGGDEAAEAADIQAAVAVRNRLEGDVVDPRQSGRWTVGQARQFTAVASREVPPRRPDLLLDQIEVVEQPFSRRRDPAVGIDGVRQQDPHGHQQALVLRQPSQEPVGCTPSAQPVPAGQDLSVLGHLLATEELRAQRRRFAGEGRREVAPPADGIAQRVQRGTNGLLAESHATDVLYVGRPGFGGTGARVLA